jgi:hypothetical protein
VDFVLRTLRIAERLPESESGDSSVVDLVANALVIAALGELKEKKILGFVSCFERQ